MNQEQALKDTLEYFKNLTPQEYEQLAGIQSNMTQELFDKVIDQVNQGSVQDGTDSWDFPDDLNSTLPISSKEFRSVHTYIHEYTMKKHTSYLIDCTKTFPNYKIFFEYKNQHYVWETVIGQGSVSYIDIDKKQEYQKHKSFVLTIDPNIKFYVS